MTTPFRRDYFDHVALAFYRQRAPQGWNQCKSLYYTGSYGIDIISDDRRGP